MKRKEIIYKNILFSISLILILFSFAVSATTSKSISTTAPCAYTTNFYEGTVSIIDIATNTVKATLPVGEWPWGVAVSPDGKKVYVTVTYGEDEDGYTTFKGIVSVIDTDTNTVTTTVPVGEWPRGVAVSPDGKTVYTVDSGKYPDYVSSVSIIDAATNVVKAKVPIGNSPQGVAVNPIGTRVYVADSNVSVIDTATNTVIATVSVGKYPYGVAVNPDGKKVYVANYESNTVSVIDTATNTVTATVPVGSGPLGVTVTPDGTQVYVTNFYSSNVSVIDTDTNTVTATVPVAYPFGVSVTPDGTKVYVGNDCSAPVSVIDTATNTVTATVDVGDSPLAFGQFIGPLSLAPFASFSAEPIEGKAPLTVVFADESTRSPTKWKWSFGDGTTSTKQNPTHKYSQAGNYTVALTVSNAAGSNTVTRTGYIQVTAKPVAAFSASPSSGKIPLTVKFTDTSAGTPIKWKWDFGDGTSSTKQNPTHRYSKAGKYTVTLTVTSAAGSNTVTKSNYITVAAKPVAAFSASPTSGRVPLNVKFTEASTGTPTKWKWNFGDGTTSVQQNPIHKYSKAGKYTITLTATNSAGSNTLTKSNYIIVTGTSQAPTADFWGWPLSGKAPLKVTFTETSTGSPTSWKWDFGDGKSSIEKSPTHTYSAAGTYTVKLTAINAAGSSTKTKWNYIKVAK